MKIYQKEEEVKFSESGSLQNTKPMEDPLRHLFFIILVSFSVSAFATEERRQQCAESSMTAVSKAKDAELAYGLSNLAVVMPVVAAGIVAMPLFGPGVYLLSVPLVATSSYVSGTVLGTGDGEFSNALTNTVYSSALTGLSLSALMAVSPAVVLPLVVGVGLAAGGQMSNNDQIKGQTLAVGLGLMAAGAFVAASSTLVIFATHTLSQVAWWSVVAPKVRTARIETQALINCEAGL
jgi:hypothetical protein